MNNRGELMPTWKFILYLVGVAAEFAVAFWALVLR